MDLGTYYADLAEGLLLSWIRHRQPEPRRAGRSVISATAARMPRSGVTDKDRLETMGLERIEAAAGSIIKLWKHH
jgi:hypothetical protein